MKMKIISLTLASMFLASIILVALTPSTQSQGEYDPWADIMEEFGKIDIFDVVAVASRYQTTGIPTRNVTVTDWPPWFPPYEMTLNYETISRTFATNRSISWGEYQYYNQSAAGYKEVTIACKLDAPSQLLMDIYFIIGGVEVLDTTTAVLISNEPVVLTFPVTFEQIKISILNTNAIYDPSYYSLGLFASA